MSAGLAQAMLRARVLPKTYVNFLQGQRFKEIYHWARKEHAFLLVCEGISKEEIGTRLGIQGNSALQMARSYGYYFNFKVRRCRVVLE
jgi:hypothetical protein